MTRVFSAASPRDLRKIRGTLALCWFSALAALALVVEFPHPVPSRTFVAFTSSASLIALLAAVIALGEILSGLPRGKRPVILLGAIVSLLSGLAAAATAAPYLPRAIAYAILVVLIILSVALLHQMKTKRQWEGF